MTLILSSLPKKIPGILTYHSTSNSNPQTQPLCQSLSVMGPKMWKSVSSQLTKIGNLDCFKRGLTTFMLYVPNKTEDSNQGLHLPKLQLYFGMVNY